MKFNSNRKAQTKANHEGEKSFVLNDHLAFYSAVCTSFMNGKFYESSAEFAKRINKMVREMPDFAAKLAIYAREDMHLRSIPIYLLVQLAKTGNLNRKVVKRVISRADEITELLAAYQQVNGRKSLKKLSMPIKKGIKDIFESDKFDEYQYAKYFGKKKEITLRDALFLTHPKPTTKEQGKLFNDIANKTLPLPKTWEVSLSEAGKNGNNKKKVWEELIFNHKLGYMATLRNLRNFFNANISAKAINEVCSYLVNPKAVLNSKQLPFRFYSAYKMIMNENYKYRNQVLDALERAFIISTANIPNIDINTSVAVLTDVSCSMMVPVSPKSIIELYDIGNVLGVSVMEKCKFADHIIFGKTFEYMTPSKDRLATVEHIRKIEGRVGYSTNAHLVIDDFISKERIYDKIFIFSDGQFWNSAHTHATDSINNFYHSWLRYKKISPNAKVYIFDLAGYGTSGLNPTAHDVTFISGWSDKIFDMMNAIENGSSVVKQIERIII